MVSKKSVSASDGTTDEYISEICGDVLKSCPTIQDLERKILMPHEA